MIVAVRALAVGPLPPSPTVVPVPWHCLSRAPGRRAALESDLYFRECWEDLQAVAPASAVRELRSRALLMFKPEAVVGRRMTKAIAFLGSNGFHPAGAARVRHSRHSMLSLWKYTRWTHNMADWIQLAHLMYTSTDTLVVVLNDVAGPGDASARLAALKGSAIRDHRDARHLREVLDPPNDILNFVHSADEPADVLRELGVLLERQERRALLDRAFGSPRDDCPVLRREVGALEAESEAHDFDFDRSLRRIEATTALPAGGRERLLRAAAGAGKLTWDELCAVVRPGRGVRAWDFVALGCAVLDL